MRYSLEPCLEASSRPWTLYYKARKCPVLRFILECFFLGSCAGAIGPKHKYFQRNTTSGIFWCIACYISKPGGWKQIFRRWWKMHHKRMVPQDFKIPLGETNLNLNLGHFMGSHFSRSIAEHIPEQIQQVIRFFQNNCFDKYC